MNDPDLDARIEDHVNEYQGEKSQSQDYSNDQSQEKQDEVRGALVLVYGTDMSSRWWFASSAFPMIAGTLGPVASAFSICALVRSWRQHRPPGTSISDAKFVADPEWLLIINAIQLAIAITSNLFLLLNMARRVRFSIAQPITIIGWYIAAFTLIALLATAAGPLQLQPSHEYIWSQAFFYGLNAAVLYFVTASLMVEAIAVTRDGFEKLHDNDDSEDEKKEEDEDSEKKGAEDKKTPKARKEWPKKKAKFRYEQKFDRRIEERKQKAKKKAKYKGKE
ncbi:hypothetical protein BN1708_005704 [Verticillium longisporum]|uniref:Uncharacterized protein n=1 Tax=Verticillium longisporum TaxID=100787 RepID=A0A0G4MDG3_VERLO|nr:hypothetical protein BN1708_005704 [Verticillium longisporum]